MHSIERVGQRAYHHVDDLVIPHAGAPTRARVGVNATTHRLGATRDCDFRVTQPDSLGS
jgi:hypothetical protein